MGPPGPAPAGKIDQTTAAYGPTDDPARSCASCAHFDGVGACEIVDGQIRPDGVSDFWEPAEQGMGPIAGPPMGGMPLG
jgi:hypothetical protein